MKKYEHLFSDPDFDKVVMPILIRSMRETSNKSKFTVEEIVKRCMNSRETNSRETLFENASFWPKDLQEGLSNYSALFLSRVINLVNFNCDRDITYNFITNYITYLSAFKLKGKDHMDEVAQAIKKIKRALVKSRSNKVILDKLNDVLEFISHT